LQREQTFVAPVTVPAHQFVVQDYK